jgi:hypothetical protein
MNSMTLLWREYNEIFKEFRENFDENHTEYAHIVQDRIYRKFINDTVEGKFRTESEYRAMALLIKLNVVIYDTPGRWWYA